MVAEYGGRRQSGRSSAGDASGSSGVELFRELLRFYPVAKLENYYQDGRWLVDRLEVDIELTFAHRELVNPPEEPPALEDIPYPELPVQRHRSEVLRPLAGGAVQRRAGSGPPPRTPTAMPGGAAAMPSAAERAAIIEATDRFVKDWGLDRSRVRVMLAKVPPGRRMKIIQSFDGGPAGRGGSVPQITAALQRHIERCERDSLRERSPFERRGSMKRPRSPTSSMADRRGDRPIQRPRPASAGGSAASGGILRPTPPLRPPSNYADRERERPRSPAARPRAASGPSQRETGPTASARPGGPTSTSGAPRAGGSSSAGGSAARPATKPVAAKPISDSAPGDLIKSLLGGL
eukprot:TRINITY_DN31318_c0_g1_i1.p1 TRINITY_DN31318_c0_g1~~TRINITY_DN31318_c0_g1_i1.p1  ORF type:complete len:349 (+),score=28.89 TRINITY_DN31318_c0_g1_i1:125-1171(+)